MKRFLKFIIKYKNFSKKFFFYDNKKNDLTLFQNEGKKNKFYLIKNERFFQ